SGTEPRLPILTPQIGWLPAQSNGGKKQRMPKAPHRLSSPLPAAERATLFRNIKEWVRGFGCISIAGNPLTRTLSPNGEREHTQFAARSCTAVRLSDFARGTDLAAGLIRLPLVLVTAPARPPAPPFLPP